MTMTTLVVSLYIIIPIFALSLNLIMGEKLRFFDKLQNIILMLLLSTIPVICLCNYNMPYTETLGGWKVGFGITLSIDKSALIFLATLYFVNLIVLLYSIYDDSIKNCSRKFFMGYWLLILGMSGAICTRDIFNLYVWSEVMLVSVFILLSCGHQKDSSLQINYATFNIIGTLCLLVAIALIYRATGSLNYYEIGARINTVPEAITLIGFGLMLFGLGIKAGLFPLYFWLPASYPHTSPSSTALLSSIVTKTILLVILRIIWVVLPDQAPLLAKTMFVVAACTMVFGVFGAVIQTKMRDILSFHIISQIGYIVLAIFIESRLAIVAAIYFILHNVLVKTNLLLISGVVEKIYGTGNLGHIGGRMLRDNNVLAILFLASALSLAGFPPLSGFWAKFYILCAAIKANHTPLALVAIAVSILTLLSMLKIWRKGCCEEQDTSRSAATLAIPHTQFLAIVLLTAGMVSIGFFPDSIINILNDSAIELSANRDII